jgi:hypothetical protein
VADESELPRVGELWLFEQGDIMSCIDVITSADDDDIGVFTVSLGDHILGGLHQQQIFDVNRWIMKGWYRRVR